MNKNNLKILCIIERVLIIAIVIGICLMDINGDVRSLIIILGIILLIYLPEQTKKKFEKKEESIEEAIHNSIKDYNDYNQLEKIELNVVDIPTENTEKKDLRIEENNDIVKSSYENPTIDLLSEDVEIRDVIQSKEYTDSKSKIIVGVKEDLNTKIIDIQETSHILIAGTTGIGKTTLLDNIIINIIYKTKPDEVKFIMFDTSNNSLRLYNGIPHLLLPVITNVKLASGVLAWIVQEIENRNKEFLRENVENLTEFNKKMETEERKKIPPIIILIDEISDIVNYDRDSINEFLAKITKQGEKAGIYMIISTNRPSSDIISGAVKANIFTRISFYLPSRLDSKVILDMDGAETLTNRGDILFKTIGIAKPEKYHCPNISTTGVKNVVNFFRNTGNNYQNDALNEINGKYFDEDEDPFLQEAIETVVETGQASTSFIQRRLKVGYARAGEIIDQLEERGIIDGYEGSKPRKVLWTIEDLEKYKTSLK